MSKSDWPVVRLGDLIEIRHGYAFAGEFFRDEPPGDILLTPGNFAIGGGFKGDKFKYYVGQVPEDYVLEAGDLLITMTDLSKAGDSLGYPAIVPKSTRVRYLHNQRLGKVLFLPGTAIAKEFLHYLLRSKAYRNEVLASATGSTVKHTSPERIKAFTFRLPPLAEQRAIAHTLGTLDDKIELNRRMNETLEAMARAIFKSWFVDFLPVRAKIAARTQTGDPVRAKAEGRQPFGMDAETAALFPDSFQDSPLDKIPNGWRVAELGDICEVIDCLHSKKPDRTDRGKPLLQLWNIRDDGLLDMSDTYWISEGDYHLWTSRIEARPGDCVITNVGRVGAVSQIPFGTFAALGRNMTGVRPKTNYAFPTFLIECLLSSAMRREIELKIDSGTILDSLNVRNIPKLRLVQPSIPVVERFEKLCSPLRHRMERNQGESCTLAAIRDVLLPKLVAGEIRVRDAESYQEAGT